MDWRWRPAAEVATRIARLLLAETDDATSATRAFPLAGFQEEAVARARRILARRGGVIIADDVGLGKTYVALALIEEALRRGDAVTLVVPASLRGAWAPLVRRIAGPDRSSSGVYVTTHARLSRGSHDSARLAGAGLVVVDEAHAFRNPATRRYRALAARGPGSRLALITATPVNNGPADLHALVRQFARDDAFADVGVVSLRASLLEAGEGSPAGEAARIAREVVVRRTRADIRERAGEAPAGFRFPRRAATAIARYDDSAVPALVSAIGRLELAPYALDLRGRAAAGPDALIRLGLLKRLESGRPAVGASLRRLRSLLSTFADAADRGRLMRPADRPAGLDDGDAMQLSLEEVLLEAAPPGTDLAALAASARRDLNAIGGMLRGLRGADPKLEAIRGWVGALEPGEKVVIFSEFRDTAAALWRALAPTGRVGRVDGGGAWLGARRAGRRAVVERFAPLSSGVAPPPARERVDILIATDVLSEGLNLQDAAIVVSYDLPWNPVRLLQRIGRIDRLGSTHDIVHPVLFVPGAGLDDVLRLTRRLRRKLGGIAATVGAGDAGELLSRLGGTVTGDPLEGLVADPGDPWERLRVRLRETDMPDEPGGADGAAGPSTGGCAVVGLLLQDSPTPPWLILARVRGDPPTLFVVEQGEEAREAGPEAAAALEVALSDATPPPGGAPRLDAERGLQAATRAVAAAVRTRAAAAQAPPRLEHRGPAA
ncbi:MAG: DEAD/DEAH box helicase, partial [Gemmatimonadetes bacterium]|nr:DEAD/DEAH box helicase [Gemmatimonadota bacterium]